jgi:hypothetical protein
MSASHDPLAELVRDWASGESEQQATRVTAAMLRARHLLAREDRRRRRTLCVQVAIITLPFLALAAALRPWASLEFLADHLIAPPPSAVAAALGAICLAALVGGSWVSE